MTRQETDVFFALAPKYLAQQPSDFASPHKMPCVRIMYAIQRAQWLTRWHTHNEPCHPVNGNRHDLVLPLAHASLSDYCACGRGCSHGCGSTPQSVMNPFPGSTPEPTDFAKAEAATALARMCSNEQQQHEPEIFVLDP